MGWSSDLKKVIKQVKKIPDIPDRVVGKLRDELDDLSAKVDKMDPVRLVAQLRLIIQQTVGSHFAALSSSMNAQFENVQKGVGATIDTRLGDFSADFVEDFGGQIRSMQKGFEKAMDRSLRSVKRLPNTMMKQFDEMREWTREMADKIASPLTDFIGSIWDRVLPWLVGVIAIALFPVYGPLLMSLFSIIF